MPVDPAAGLQPARTGNHPYPCSTRDTVARAEWSIDRGYCATSLDWHAPRDKTGSSDPRCPATCPHKAPEKVALSFAKLFAWRGAAAAAEMARQHKEKERK